jgi:hypothetical protein
MSNLPSITATQHELPFTQLSYEQFERLCLRLIQARGYRRAEHLGLSGSEKGRDIVAWEGKTRVAVQCKRVREFKASDGLREIEKLLTVDQASRPQRVIFMVTCSISSRARDQIRHAWGGDEDSCEFVGVTELDAEVRRSTGILREFFQGAPPADETHEQKRPRRRHESTAELRKFESSNRDWIVTTRSFQFRRLLQAIEELEYLSGRLEAGRALYLAVRKSGADTRPTEPALLKICEDLDVDTMFQLDWTLRRTLARVVGDVIGQLGSRQFGLVGHFCEERLSTRRGVLLLAEAASEHTAAALAIGGPILRQLLLSAQPQATWQLLRRWPLVSPAVPQEVEIEEIREMGTTSTRRMLFLTRLQVARNSSEALKNLLSAAEEGVAGALSNVAEHPFHRALRAWAAMNTTVDMPGGRSRRGLLLRIEDVLHVASWARSRSDTLTGQIAQALELDGIERDLRNAVGGYQPHPRERYSEGRYGYTRNYVRRAIRIVPEDQMSGLLSHLLHCADEGIRWAVGAEVRNWWVRSPDLDAAIDIVLRLVDDEHPWVVRETLQQLAVDPPLCQAIGVGRLVRHAENRRQRAEMEGWETGELVAAIRRVAAHMPP